MLISNQQFSVVQQLCLSFLLLIILVVGLVGNSVVCVLVFRKPAMRSAINLLLATLALSDALTCLICFPLLLVCLLTDGSKLVGDRLLHAHAFLHSVWLIESASVLTVISVDRFIIIVLKCDKLSGGHARLVILFSWIGSTVVSLPGWIAIGYQCKEALALCEMNTVEDYGEKVYFFTFFCFIFLVPSAVMAFAYFKIIKIVRHSLVRIRNYPDAENELQLHTHNIASRTKRQFLVDMRFKTRTFTTILILFLVFLFCRLPYSVGTLVWNLSSSPPTAAHIYLIWWNVSSCAWNPIIYGWRIHKFRKTFANLVPKKCHQCFNARKLNSCVKPGRVYELRHSYNSIHYHGNSV